MLLSMADALIDAKCRTLHFGNLLIRHNNLHSCMKPLTTMAD